MTDLNMFAIKQSCKCYVAADTMVHKIAAFGGTNYLPVINQLCRSIQQYHIAIVDICIG